MGILLSISIYKFSVFKSSKYLKFTTLLNPYIWASLQIIFFRFLFAPESNFLCELQSWRYRCEIIPSILIVSIGHNHFAHLRTLLALVLVSYLLFSSFRIRFLDTFVQSAFNVPKLDTFALVHQAFWDRHPLSLPRFHFIGCFFADFAD